MKKENDRTAAVRSAAVRAADADGLRRRDDGDRGNGRGDPREMLGGARGRDQQNYRRYDLRGHRGRSTFQSTPWGRPPSPPSSDYIKQVIFPLQLRSIKHDSFAGCTSLERIELSVNISYIGENAFKGCTSLERIELPASISSIDYSAFEGCTSLKEVFIPAGLRRLEPYAFTRCSSLTRFVVDPENEYFEADAEGVLYNAQMKK